jgi:methyltransferase
MVSVYAYLAFLALLGGERLLELVISRRNARLALARGGVELGRRHFRVMTLLHGSLFVACAAEVVLLERAFVPALGYPMLALALAAQGLRYWAIRSLGRCWNVRVIVVPGERAVARGPYRFVRHPNYLAVVLEMAAVPLVHGAYVTALVYSALNAVLLAVRIRCEERALARHCQGYQDLLGGLGRFIPAPKQAAEEP